MTPEEIKKLSRKYVEEKLSDALKFFPTQLPDSMEVLVKREQESVSKVIEWLSKDYCIVSKSKVLEEYNYYKNSWTELEPNEDVIESFERQRELIRQIGEDMDRLVDVFGKIKALAKSQPRKTKSYIPPYAKFDKYHHKKKRK